MTTAEHKPGSVGLIIFAGQVMVGGCVSFTVMVKLQLGPASVEQVTVVTPTGKKDPDAGLQVTVPQLRVVGAG